MVILSAAVCNEQGKALLARQFASISRLRIEGLLSAFPKLIDAENGCSKQHTFVETPEVRYLYQPMDGLWILIITDKNSNILDDLSTLRLMAKLIPEYCEGHDEASIANKSFELCFAFDEVVSLGYREDVTLQQIRNFTAMDSHEEKLHNIIRESKENEARDHMKRKAEAIDKEKREKEKLEKATASFGGSGKPFSLNLQNSQSSFGGFNTGNQDADNGEQDLNNYSVTPKPVPKRPKKNRKRPQGMRLGSSQNVNMDLAKALQEEKGQNPFASLNQSEAVDESEPAGMVGDQLSAEKVDIFIREMFTVALDREGGLKKFEIKGSLTVGVNDPDFIKIALKTTSNDRPITYTLNPKFNRKKWKADRVISFKDKKSKFSVGSSQAKEILRWGFTSEDKDLLPVTITFWPETSEENSTLTVDYEVEQENIELHNVVVSIPCPAGGERPEAEGDGQWSYSRQEQQLQWQIGSISTGDSGSIEFIVGAQENDDFYPINIDFESPNIFSELDVSAIINTETKEPCEFNKAVSLVTDNYSIQ